MEEHHINIEENLRTHVLPTAKCTCGKFEVTRSTVGFLYPEINKHVEETGHELRTYS